MEALRDTSDLLGLGDTVDRYKEIPADTRARVIDVLRSYVVTANRSHAERLTLIGTEPLRRARNAQTLGDEIKAATGLSLHVLTEREEAILTFVGVTRGQPPASPLIVVDIGGGSRRSRNGRHRKSCASRAFRSVRRACRTRSSSTTLRLRASSTVYFAPPPMPRRV